MKSSYCLSIALVTIFSSTKIMAQQPVFSQAKTERVQLYFNGAEMTQSAKAKLPKGNSELVLLNVANYLDENTIQIKSTPNVTVLSVQFSTQPIEGLDAEYISETARPIRDSIQLIENEIASNNLRKTSAEKSIELLDKNQKLGDNISTAELAKLVDFYDKKRFEIGTQLAVFHKKDNELQRKLSRLKFLLGTNASQNAHNKGKLVLQVLNNTAGEVPFQLNYVAYGAGWQPSYEVRVDKINSPVTLAYNAHVTQNTGVDWTNVKLSLSSGYVNQNTQAPTVNPWFVGYRESPVLEEVVSVRGRNKAAYKVSDMAGAPEPILETAPVLENKHLDNLIIAKETQLNVVFDIDMPYTILSNNKRHSVAMKTHSIPATYTYYTAPKLDPTTYLVGSIENYGGYNLLPGQANLIFEGMYVGKTYINPERTNEKMPLSLGKDKRISIDRKLITERSGNKVLTSKKTQSYTYEITVRNNKNEVVNMEVEDQYPISTDKDIKVTLLQSDGAEINHEKAALKWKLTLKPNETQKIRFGYQIESPREKILDIE